MKRVFSLFLAVLMVVAAVPAMALTAAAQGEGQTPSYVIYQEDFEALDASWTKYEVLQALGWYVPEAFRDTDAANYAVKVQNPGQADENKVLQISTVQPGGLENDGVVTIMGSDMMSIVREGNFTVSYELTYRAGTTNADGYSALIYNFNERDGLVVAEGNVTAYGIAAVRACGTGMNGLFYPRYTAAEYVSIEDAPNAAENVLTNRYSVAGAYPSLYARLTGAEENENDTRTGTVVMQDIKLSISLDYDYEKGVSVYVNGILVSSPIEKNRDANYNTYSWEDFITRNSGYALSLMTKANVVAEIDNIMVTAENIGTELEPEEMPELLVTEICAAGAKINGTEHGWAEYLEIYNPTDRYIDLAEYTVTVRNYYYEGDIDAIFTDNRYDYYNSLTYGYLIDLGQLMGSPLVSKTVFYVAASEISEYEGRIAFANPSTSTHVMQDDGSCSCHPSHDTGARYSKNDDGKYVRDANGMFCAVHFVESWNARYQQGAEDYNSNTTLAPGECALIYFMSDSSKNCWNYGVNAGQNQSFAISSERSFRNVYQNHGLGVYTKVIAQNACNMGNNIQRVYGIAKTYDENGVKLTKSMTVHQAMKSHVVSYAEFASPFVGAGMYETDGHLPESSNFGKTGVAGLTYSAVYLYGVDASSSPSRGTLYNFNNSISSTAYAHIGKLSSAQKVLLDLIYKKDTVVDEETDVKTREPAELMITEIVPRTNNLLGEDKSAFSAMELTNTSDHALNLYRYSLVRTEQDYQVYPDKTFTRAVALRPGNPVDKGLANGAYYYFAQDYISNPETCILQPGESVVIWFLTEGTYESYMYDVDFGFDYFRQYWANNGSPQLAVKRADGSYATQVIAVDGMMNATYNADNANKVFNLSPSGSNVYGVALAGAEETLVLPEDQTTITASNRPCVPDDMIVSAAFLGNAATYYQLTPIIVNNTEGVPVLVNKLSYSMMPANMGMRYVAGLSGSSKCSQMLNTMKVQLYKYTSDNSYTPTLESGLVPRVLFRTNVALMTPSLGKLDGKEIYPVKDSYIYSVTDSEQNVTNHVANIANLYVQTLTGAALSTSGATARLRFDAALPADQFADLVALCGAENVKVSTLVFESAAAQDMTTITKQALSSAGVGYVELETNLMYYKESFAVVGAYFNVSAAEYATSYTAITYIEYTLPGADYASVLYSGATASASVKNVAQSALWDTVDAQTSQYLYATADGEYSRYSPAVQEKLRAYSQA